MTISSTPIWTLVPAVLGLLVALGPPAQVGSKDKEKKREDVPAPAPVLDPWRGDFESAKASAKERNVPIVVHVILEGEKTNDEYRDTILTDPGLVKRCAHAVVLIANNGTHALKTIELVVDGETTHREVCSSYPMVAKCEEHKAAWDELYTAFRDESGDLNCPQAIVLGPDGSLVGRINTRSTPQPGEIGALLVAAIAKAGPGLTIDELARVKRGLVSGRKLAAEKNWMEAWKTWTEVLAITQTTTFAEEARTAEPLALAGMQAEFDRITAGLVPGTAAKSYAELLAFAEAAVGTPLEKDAATSLKKADGDKSIRDELKAWRLAKEADELLREATALHDAGETKKAERLVRRLLTPRFAGTPAQETARKLWPDLANG